MKVLRYTAYAIALLGASAFTAAIAGPGGGGGHGAGMGGGMGRGFGGGIGSAASGGHFGAGIAVTTPSSGAMAVSRMSTQGAANANSQGTADHATGHNGVGTSAAANASNAGANDPSLASAAA